MSEGIDVSGRVQGRYSMRCARCLKAFTRGFDLEMAELVPREAGPEDDYALASDLTLDPARHHELTQFVPRVS